MNLDQFLSLPDSPTAAEFGAMCEPPLSGPSISRIRNGAQNITRDTIRSIIAASNGKVTANDLVGRAAA